MKDHRISQVPEVTKLQVGDEEVEIEVRKLPWSKKNQIISNSTSWDKSGVTRFNFDSYIKEALIYMIVKAPWGETNHIFLTSIDEELGAALESIVPKAFAGSSSEGLDGIKKESEGV